MKFVLTSNTESNYTENDLVYRTRTIYHMHEFRTEALSLNSEVMINDLNIFAHHTLIIGNAEAFPILCVSDFCE